MEDLVTKTHVFDEKIKSIIKKSIEVGNYEKALAAISSLGDYLYQYNQYYVDDELENFLCQISNLLSLKYNFNKDCRKTDKIIFYDGFGLDTRGVALMYLNGLGLNNYHVIYITNKNVINSIPLITNMCNKYHFEMKFINMDNYIVWIKQLSNLILEISPKSAFFYSTPNDVSGIVAFNMFKGKVDRYLIDLTDHAFWLGKSAADYFLGSRNMSASLQFFYRGIKKEQMIKLGVNLLVDETQDHSDLPFDPEHTKYIFSGGSLYKTLGAPGNPYYEIIDNILSKFKNIKFLYAGYGDDTELKKIVEKYPNQAFHIDERKDFYYLIQNCILYLNTYPMFGGMMMKYCALAHKLPITLKHGHDSDGLLLHQEECNVEYENLDELIDDVERLLQDDFYRKSREKLLDGSVITEDRFKNNIKSVIENHTTDYQHEYIEIDTSEFRKEYYERFNYNNQMLNMVKLINITLFNEFPNFFWKGFFVKIINKVKIKIGE